MIHPFMRPNDWESVLEYMYCPKCKEPALQEYWEHAEMEHDELQCPSCGQCVKIGEWIDGQIPVKQRTLFDLDDSNQERSKTAMAKKAATKKAAPAKKASEKKTSKKAPAKKGC